MGVRFKTRSDVASRGWLQVRLRPYNGTNEGAGTRQPARQPARPGLSAMPTPNELYDEAVDLRDQGDRAGAIAKLEEAVTQDPAFALGHGMLAKLYVDVA